MNPEILQNFIQKTQSELPEILGAIMTYWQDTGALESLQTALRQMRSITENATEFNLTEVSFVSRAIADTLQEIETSQMLISSEQNQFLLEQFSNLDYLLSISKESVYGICANAETLTEDFFGELELSEPPIGEFSDEDIRLEKSADSADENGASQPDEETDEFEIDEEMLEIFALEAEDHLRNISANLSILENKNDDRDALLEIRRSAHTLKGSAGIVGFTKISKLAHRVEDLLDYISDHGIVGNAKIFELLMLSTDCLESLANGQNSPELNEKINELYGRFDELIAFLQNSVLPAPEKIEAIIEPIEIREEVAAIPPENFVAPEIPATDELLPTENQPPASDRERRSVVRVSLERLDDLVKLASEMIVTRSTFENRLADLEQQIQELLHSTNRLRRATGKLEIDFEASTLGSKKTVFQPSNLSGANPRITLGEQDAEFDSLEFDRYTEFHQTTRELIETAGDVSAIRNNFDGLLGDFSTLFDTQRRIVEEIQEGLMRLRMVPLNSIASRIFRAVRVTAAEEGKLADLHLENGDIEIDTQILDTFVEPLLHLLRNAVAHGIESPEIRRNLGKSEKGKITFKAFNEGTHIVFVISDDGRGIEVEKLKEKAVSAGFITLSEAQTMNDEEAFSLIFLPGLSTSKQISQISGRGVGMNVVKAHITRRQGTISVKSEPQTGTSFTIRLPMSLAVTRALLVKTHDQNFAFPLKIVRQVVEATAAELEQATREKYLNIHGKNYRFFNFSELVNALPPVERFSPKTSVLILETSENPCAVAVENILRTEEIVVKPLGSILQNVQELIGATIMGDGSVIPVLDLIYLVNQHQKSSHSVTVAESNEESAPTNQTLSVLIVDDSPSVRHLNSNLIKNAGWKAIVAKDGLEALEILQSVRELPCVILTDVEMPRMDGYEFLAAVKKQESLKEIPVIMITSRASDKHRRKAYEMGVSEYLNKPFEESSLLETIRRLSR